MTGAFQKKSRSNNRLVRIRRTLVNTCLLFSSLILAVIITELTFIFLNVEPKVSLKGLYTSDPIVGYVNTPNFSVRNNNWFRPFWISINSHGLRGPEFTMNQKNKLRILVLGDSITFGIYVNDNETFCRLLEKEAREEGIPLEVLNAGVGGYWPRNELHWFRSRGIGFEPDIVIIVLFIGNDVKGELREVGDVVVRDGLLYARNGEINGEKGESIGGLYSWFRMRRIYQFICHKYWIMKKMMEQEKEKGKFIFSEIFDRKGFQREAEAYERLMTTLRELARMCQGEDIGFLVVLVPTFEQVNFDQLNIGDRSKYDMKRPNRKIVSMAQSEGIPILDLLGTSVFQISDDLYLPLERIHLSPEGHRVVAKNLYTSLKNRGFFQGVRKMPINKMQAIRSNTACNYATTE